MFKRLGKRGQTDAVEAKEEGYSVKLYLIIAAIVLIILTVAIVLKQTLEKAGVKLVP